MMCINRKQNVTEFFDIRFLWKICGIFFFLSIVIFPSFVHSKMYLWKDEQGVFNASEQKPSWWPKQKNCIAWVPGRKKKVVDFRMTQKKLKTCDIEIKDEEKEKKNIVKRKIEEEPEPVKEIIEPTDREVRIYCAYRKALMNFLDIPNTEEASAEYVGKKYDVTADEIEIINSKVVDFKGGDYKCTY